MNRKLRRQLVSALAERANAARTWAYEARHAARIQSGYAFRYLEVAEYWRWHVGALGNPGRW